MILHSGISLPILPTVEKIHIAGGNAQHDNTETLSGISYRNQYRRHGDAQSANQEALTEKDILNIFRYGMKCRRIKELMFDQHQLPTSISPEAITNIIKTRNIRVRWHPFDIDFHLDLQNGHWEVDDTYVLENIRNSTVSIDCRHSKLQQRSTVQLLHVAHRRNVTISCLHLKESFSEIDAGSILLHSKLRLLCPASVKKVVIHTEEGRTMKETEVVEILMFVQQLHMLEELEFGGCLLPLTFSLESIPAENIKVLWSNYGYCLDLQSGIWKVNDLDTVKLLCTEQVNIEENIYEDLLQRCTIKLLENASYHDIPISCLFLSKSFSKIDAGDVILHSGLRLSCPVSVKKVVIQTERGREMTESEVVDILMFVQQSYMLEELEFFGCLLPSISSWEAIPFKTRDIKVLWMSYGYSLNLQSGAWEVDEDIVKRICLSEVSIYRNDSDLQQRCTIQLLENASYHYIPISWLYMEETFSKIEAGDVILHSGLRLSCPLSVKNVVINTEKGREMTETEVVNILMFVQRSYMLKELTFKFCLLPQPIPAESIPSILKSRNVKVSWRSSYQLNLQSGRWMDIFTRQEITDTEYNKTVTSFRDGYSYAEWQMARISSESESEIESENDNENNQ